ncbi:class I SAM-dependent methyltransferase [Saccharothrix australiensis]|uniref:Methyltransferase family protein n=1 Tax=Saccharothrix australiensis TaxID=2072 RepID=A0A495W055_9PSEU|nr:class I SAM-dependent methyltransferase [Saccharothrix australiensis]RKT54163.1 methyltransferase family protein [Saccharothrix australiensis]
MGTVWKGDDEVAAGFDSYDDLFERTLGYPAVFSALGLGAPEVRTVLDYGCGPGKIALRVAERYDVDVHAADISDRMLHIARTRRAHPRIRYHLIGRPSLDFLPDDSVDAAMCCFVFVTVGDPDRLRAITAEVHRVLRPGGRFAVLDTNPDTTGIRFSTFRTGEPATRYEPGQQRRTVLYLPDGGALRLLDHHWPRDTCRDLLAEAGFRDVDSITPLLGDTDRPPPGAEHPAEAVHPPFLITAATK